MTKTNMLIQACKSRNRAAISSLLESIPRDEWNVEERLATTLLAPIIIRVWYIRGGSGINTYKEVGVVVQFEDQEGPDSILYQGKFSDEELTIANFIPIDMRNDTTKN